VEFGGGLKVAVGGLGFDAFGQECITHGEMHGVTGQDVVLCDDGGCR
jgi:hypothetical protein